MIAWLRLLLLALLLAPASAWASETGFPEVGDDWANGIWSDGAGTLWLLRGGTVLELQRGATEPCRHETGVWGGDGIAGLGVGAGAILAVWAEGGKVMVKKGDRFAPIAPAGGKITALAVSSQGEVVAASERDLRVWDGRVWTAYAYPPGVSQVGDIVRGQPGELLLVTAGHHILRFADRALREIAVPDMPAAPYDDRLPKGWYDGASQTLWLSSIARQVVAVDLSQDPPTTRTFTTEVFGSPRALSGIQGTSQVVLAGQSDVVLLEDGATVSKLGGVTFAEGLVIDRHEPAAYFANRDGIARFALPGSGQPPPLPSAPCKPETARELPEVAVEAAEVVPPAYDDVMQEEPYDDGELDFFGFPQLRVALGPAFHMASGASAETSFTLDVASGARLMWVNDDDVGWGIRPELGYGYDSSDAVGGHRLVVGAGPIWGHWAGSVALTPRFVVGSVGDETAAGLRYGVLGEVLVGALSTELSHQILFADAATLHDVRVTFGVDPLVIASAFLLASIFDDIWD